MGVLPSQSISKLISKKIILANEATKLLHGEKEAKIAEETALKTFQDRSTGEGLPSVKIAEKELNNIFEPTVKLKSGGYLVINPTEALVSIDVNSGKSIKQKNVESTALDLSLIHI